MVSVKCVNMNKECNHIKKVVDSDTGETICSTCGMVLVVDNIVSDNVFTYDTEGNNKSSSYINSPLMGAKGLGSLIQKQGKAGLKLNDTQKYLLPKGKNVAADKALVEFSKLQSRLNLPESLIIDAINLYVRFKKTGSMRGRETTVAVSAFGYVAAKRAGVKLSIQDICKKMLINSKLFFTMYSLIIQKLEINVSKLDIQLPEHFVNRFISKLNIGFKNAEKCKKVVKLLQKSHFHVGKNPKVIATVGIYIALLNTADRCTQREVCAVSEITEVSVRNIYKAIKDLSMRDEPDAALFRNLWKI